MLLVANVTSYYNNRYATCVFLSTGLKNQHLKYLLCIWFWIPNHHVTRYIIKPLRLSSNIKYTFLSVGFKLSFSPLNRYLSLLIYFGVHNIIFPYRSIGFASSTRSNLTDDTIAVFSIVFFFSFNDNKSDLLASGKSSDVVERSV